MNFFQSQETARRNTFGLVLLFVLAVLSLIVITNLLVMVVFGFFKPGEEGLSLSLLAARFDWTVFGIIGAFVSLIILAGSVYKTTTLSDGGSAVAESIGGRLISPGSTDLHERKTLNVVEEMAIASGTPVPPVYLLANESGINAFAAGYTPGDAVIGVTHGAIAYLTRDELQGVIAHEFSHILNGDMRLNMRLICILQGILLIGLIGYYTLRSTRGSSSKSTLPMLGLGLGLIAIGYSGTFFGNLIKASVNRQREFLADASAVQFTRNKNGIADALKKIGGHAPGSLLRSPGASSMSHVFFTTGIKTFLQSVMATHPPLGDRIKRIDPQWDGLYKTLAREVREGDRAAQPTMQPPRTDWLKTAMAGAALAGHLPDSAGPARSEQLDCAAALINEIPADIREAVYEPYGARAVIYCLVINDQADIQKKQLQQLWAFGDSGIFDLVNKILVPVKSLDIRFRLPLIDMAMPSLRQLSGSQYRAFKNNLHYLVKIDNRIDLFEWSLQQILFHHLDPQFGQRPKPAAKSGTFKSVKEHINILMSMLVHACVQDKSQVNVAFAKAEDELGMNGILIIAPQQIKLDTLGAAIEHLAMLQPRFKHHLLKACLRVITQDQAYTPNEMELMRAIAAALDHPLPPCPLNQEESAPSDRTPWDLYR